MIEVSKSLRNYPKVERYTLAERTEKMLLGGAENIFFAVYNARTRMDRLKEARTQFQMVTFLLRIAKRQGFISEGFYEKITLDIVEVGKMISGWLKTCEVTRKPDAKNL